MLSDKNCCWSFIVNSWHVGWSFLTCPSHMLCGLVKFETHRKQQGLFLKLLHLFVWVFFFFFFHSKCFPLYFCFGLVCLFFLPSKPSWYKLELKIVYYHLIDIVPWQSSFSILQTTAFFPGLEILDNAKGARIQHITNPAPSVTGLWVWSPCPTCQSWVDTRHTQCEKPLQTSSHSLSQTSALPQASFIFRGPSEDFLLSASSSPSR